MNHATSGRLRACAIFAAAAMGAAAVSPLRAQTPCDCAATLATTVHEIETNYAGFPGKVTDATRARYDALVGALRDSAAAASRPADCQRVLDRYIAFFQDGHLAVTSRWAVARSGETTDTVFRAYRADPRTIVVRLPSFENAYAERIDSLFSAQRDTLRSTGQVIVDLRGNGGGSDYNYWELLPLIYTNQIITKNVAMYATPDNIRRLQEIASDTTLPAAARASLQQRIDALRRNLGGFVSGRDDRTMFERVLPYPRRVGVLFDRGCASSCEQFLLAARQSTKVTLYGENSAGILDYANVLHVPLDACSGMTLRYGTTRSLRLPNDPVDPAGIPPQVRIPADTASPIDFVRRDLEARAAH